MAVADYVTKDEPDALEKRLTKTISDIEERLEAMLKKYSREQADRTIEAIQRGTSPNF